MPLDELLTRWTVRAALLCFVATVAARLRGRSEGTARLLWTLGCLAFLLHVVCAFGFYHHWSHREAYEATARQTAEVVGMNWGGGLYWNYAFAAIWLLDAGWWWLYPAGYRARPRFVDWAVVGFMAFMAFNGTVVFGSGFIRWAGLTATLLLGVAAIWRLAK